MSKNRKAILMADLVEASLQKFLREHGNDMQLVLRRELASHRFIYGTTILQNYSPWDVAYPFYLTCSRPELVLWNKIYIRKQPFAFGKLYGVFSCCACRGMCRPKVGGLKSSFSNRFERKSGIVEELVINPNLKNPGKRALGELYDALLREGLI